MELTDYERYDRTPNLIHYYEGFFCKTQYAGAKIHVLVCTIIELTEKYIEYSRIYDEADYHGTGDMQKAAESFWESTAQIKALGEKLKEMAKGTGLEIISGYEM